MNRHTAHALGALCASVMAYAAFAASGATQAAQMEQGYTVEQIAAKNALFSRALNEAELRRKCGADDWLCALANQPVKRGR